MSKKNSSVTLKKDSKYLAVQTKVYSSFKKKLDSLNHKSYLVAVSGGPDSLALAGLSKNYSRVKKTKFEYVLVNHNIRKNSDKEANNVKNILKKHKIKLIILSNKEKINKNIQGKARNIRYDLLTKYSIKKKIKIILTAHNFEDQVETFFIRLSRGSGLKGLSAMKTLTKLNNRVYIFRPLLDIKKKFLIRISKKIFGKYITDPSNIDKKYLRTKIRSLKEPLRRSGISYDQIFKSISNLASSKETLDEYYLKIFKDTVNKTKGKLVIKLKKFEKYNNEIKIQVINECIKLLKKNYYNPRAKKVIGLIQKMQNKDFKKSTLGSCIFIKEKDQIYIKSEKK